MRMLGVCRRSGEVEKQSADGAEYAHGHEVCHCRAWVCCKAVRDKRLYRLEEAHETFLQKPRVLIQIGILGRRLAGIMKVEAKWRMRLQHPVDNRLT